MLKDIKLFRYLELNIYGIYIPLDKIKITILFYFFIYVNPL